MIVRPDQDTGSLTNQPDSSAAEVSTCACVADVAGSLGGKYWSLYNASNKIKYHVWYDVDNGSADPAPAGSTAIEVDISANDVADTVASATQAAIDALGDFSASVVTNTVTVTNSRPGASTDSADVDSGHTVGNSSQGALDANPAPGTRVDSLTNDPSASV